MSWFQRLYETYDCVKASEKNDFEIAPIAHTHKVCKIEVTLNEMAEMIDAQVINEDTIVRKTDKNNCQWSLEVDIETFKEDSYRQILKEWIDFDKDNKKLNIISNYVQRGTLIQDLAKRKILYVNEEFNLIEKSKEHKIPKEIINKYKILQDKDIKKQGNAFIRWVVGCEKDRNTWKDEAIIESWIDFRKKKLEEENKKSKKNSMAKSMCYITGNYNTPIAIKHPMAKGLRRGKLISSEDDKNFIFNGRFIKQNEALNIGFDVTNKAHNVLEWLVSDERKQAYRNYSQIIVAFTINGKGGDVGEVFGKDFVKSIKGYDIKFEQFEQNENIVILEMDAASKGRACITYYREMASSQYLRNIENWHKKYYWQQFLKIKNKDNQKEEYGYKYFDGTPSIDTIANAYFYKKNKYSIEKKEKKIKSKLIKDLMPSVLGKKNIPEYIERHFIEKASNPVALNDDQWKTILGIACSIYKGNHLYVYDGNKKEEDCLMLNEENNTRDYLYGRLLAVVDYAEEKSLRIQQKSRDINLENKDKDKVRITNAKRYMRQFTLKPYSTWQMLLLRYNEAYMPRLKKNNPGLERIIDKLKSEIENKFINEGDYQNDNKLAGIYQLAYSCQMYKLREYKNKEISRIAENDKSSKGE
jgi:CRISPR-associated protein Csd1